MRKPKDADEFNRLNRTIYLGGIQHETIRRTICVYTYKTMKHRGYNRIESFRQNADKGKKCEYNKS